MKKIKLSFLFFCILCCFLYSKQVRAQQATDSLRYYYHLYTKAKGGSDLYKIYNFYHTHKEMSLQKKDTFAAVYDLRFIASIQYRLGRHHESDASAVTALKLLQPMKTTPQILEAKIGLLNHLGIVSYELKNYDRALELYDRVLKITTSTQHIHTVYNNKANVYKKKNDYALAYSEFNKVHQHQLKSGNPIEIARSLDNLGLVESKLNYDDALTHMLEALKIRQQENNTDEIFVSYKHLAEYYMDRNQVQKVKYYANKAYNLAEKVKNTSYKLEALSLLLNVNKNAQVMAYKKLSDSVALAEQLSKNKFASMKYDFSKEKKKADDAKFRLVESELQEEKEKKSKIIYQAIAGFILLLLLSSYFIFRVKYKKGKLEEIYKTETRISRKVHDEVANDVYHVITQLQSDAHVKEDVLDELEGIYNKTRDISKEHSDINMDAHFNELLTDLLISYKNNSTNVITKNISKMNWNKVSKEKKTAIYRTLQELMTNMKKHSKATLVVLVFNQHRNKIIIDFKDNGIGCDLKKHTGLQNVENRIQTANGTIIFDTEIDKGFKAKITI